MFDGPSVIDIDRLSGIDIDKVKIHKAKFRTLVDLDDEVELRPVVSSDSGTGGGTLKPVTPSGNIIGAVLPHPIRTPEPDVDRTVLPVPVKTSTTIGQTVLLPVKTLPPPGPVSGSVGIDLELAPTASSAPMVLGGEAAVGYMSSATLPSKPPDMTGPVRDASKYDFGSDGTIHQIGDVVYVEEEKAEEALEMIARIVFKEPNQARRVQANIRPERLVPLVVRA